MSDVIIFGGTTEGRRLAEFCGEHKIQTVVCVVSEYGEMLVPESPSVRVIRKALEKDEMEALFVAEKPSLVLDATHPYARVVTENVTQVCQKMGIVWYRVLRKSELETKNADSIVTVDSVDQAVEWLKSHEGTVLVTTGSKELVKYTAIPDYKERIFARILPDSQALLNSETLGFPRNHMIAMQGPFSLEMNIATMRMTGANYLVTKESGHAGGFLDKIHAAEVVGATALVIGRPLKETGISLEEACQYLEPFGMETITRTITLIGIGMGAPGMWTVVARKTLLEADAVAGASRMIESVEKDLGEKAVMKAYDGKKILDWFEHAPQLRKLAVLYSGDTGFYSGASGLAETLRERQKAGKDQEIQLEILPGISTVSYLASKLQIPWQDLELESLHGREAKPWEALERGKNVFLLLGGVEPVAEVSRMISEHGFGSWLVSAGKNLSYDDEEILTDTAENMMNKKLGDGLWAVIIRKSK
ncbi:MAG: precorrin-6A reductase [Lachnospiraceae bacterium]|nr:precorrin-6A reductase [Lachnospiraceae bacterium]